MNRLFLTLKKLWLVISARDYWQKEWDMEVSEGIVRAEGENHRLPASKPEIQAYLLQLLQIAPGEIFLDVGCGAGHMLVKVAPIVKEACGIDLSPQMVGLAREFISCQISEFDNYSVQTGSITAIPFSEGYFDKILINGVIHYLKKQELAIACREIGRVIKPGGMCVIGEVPRSDFPWRSPGFRSRRYLPEELQEVFSPLFTSEIIQRGDALFDMVIIRQ